MIRISYMQMLSITMIKFRYRAKCVFKLLLVLIDKPRTEFIQFSPVMSWDSLLWENPNNDPREVVSIRKNGK